MLLMFVFFCIFILCGSWWCGLNTNCCRGLVAWGDCYWYIVVLTWGLAKSLFNLLLHYNRFPRRRISPVFRPCEWSVNTFQIWAFHVHLNTPNGSSVRSAGRRSTSPWQQVWSQKARRGGGFGGGGVVGLRSRVKGDPQTPKSPRRGPVALTVMGREHNEDTSLQQWSPPSQAHAPTKTAFTTRHAHTHTHTTTTVRPNGHVKL